MMLWLLHLNHFATGYDEYVVQGQRFDKMIVTVWELEETQTSWRAFFSLRFVKSDYQTAIEDAFPCVKRVPSAHSPTLNADSPMSKHRALGRRFQSNLCLDRRILSRCEKPPIWGLDLRTAPDF